MFLYCCSASLASVVRSVFLFAHLWTRVFCAEIRRSFIVGNLRVDEISEFDFGGLTDRFFSSFVIDVSPCLCRQSASWPARVSPSRSPRMSDSLARLPAASWSSLPSDSRPPLTPPSFVIDVSPCLCRQSASWPARVSPSRSPRMSDSFARLPAASRPPLAPLPRLARVSVSLLEIASLRTRPLASSASLVSLLLGLSRSLPV